jgi:alkanesulfonate monooxygenase SsuD/methylene tetrahydromethanopterin reductase-like flavin-dependent oxidoreductase (luciferase family)
MKVGLLLVFQNFLDQITDHEMYEREIALALLAEPLGLDTVSAVEHHFFSYAMCPDNIQFLSYLAAKTERIGLLTGAVILPWNNPLRVVEKMILLDHLSKGRAIFGIGRGLAKREYGTFGIDMNEARDRFDEAADMIIRGLETGIVEGDGPYYKQIRTAVRPGPYASFKGRINCVAMSSDSVPVCARLGAKMMSFAQKPWDQMVPHYETYRKLFLQYNNRQPPAPICVDFLVCSDSADEAEALARQHITNYYVTLMDHYDMAGDHFKQMKGYGDYATNAALIKEAGGAAAEAFVNVNLWGTPKQILEKLDKRRQIIGDFDLTVQISFGGMSGDKAQQSLRLFAKRVLPELRSWQSAA